MSYVGGLGTGWVLGWCQEIEKHVNIYIWQGRSCVHVEKKTSYIWIQIVGYIGNKSCMIYIYTAK